MCSERSLRGSYILAVYTHIHIHSYLCTDQPLNRKRHFFRSAANKEIWHLETIRRAVILDVDFVINGGQDGHCVNRRYRQYTHTFTYKHICAQISYKRHFLRIKKYGTRRAALRIASFITTSGKSSRCINITATPVPKMLRN